jgi:predicted permease
MDSWIKDLRFGFRTLIRRPIVTGVAILSIALGVGANGAVFSLVNGLLLRPPRGVEAPDELVRVYQLRKSFEWPLGLSVPDFRDLREATAEQVSSIGGHTLDFFGLSLDGAPPRSVAGGVVLGDYFGTLGAQPSLGRLFGRAEVDAHEPVVVLAHDFWRDQLAGDPQAIGRAVALDGQTFTIAGVAARGFVGNEALFAPDLWVPLSAVDRLRDQLEERDALSLRVTARLREGVSRALLEDRLTALSTTLAAEHPATNEGATLHAMPDADARIEAGLGGPMKLIAALLLVLVALVLLIACANVANLLLARAASRRRELALRVAVGASRGALVRQLLIESLLLAAGGGVLGAAIAMVTGGALARVRPPGELPIRLDVAPDARVYAYVAFVALLAGLAFGLLPALRASRSDPAVGLKVSLVGSGSGGGRLRSGGALVVVQVALSLVLLVGGGLFLRSLDQAQAVDIGLDASHVLTIGVDVSALGRSAEEGRTFYRDVVREVGEIAGVEGVTVASWVPMDWMADGMMVGVGRDLGKDIGDELLTLGSWVGDDYFELMKTPIVEGRAFVPGDDESGRPVIIVNRAFADRVWPGESALGKTLRLDGRSGRPVEVVGVAATGKYRLLGEAPRPYFFLPFAQGERLAASILVRSNRPPGPLLEEVQKRIASLEPDLAIRNAGPLDASIQARALAPIQLVAGLASAFGLIGLLLASTGLYAVIAFSVAQRVREIGVRMALGARASQVANAILGEGLRLAAVGVAIGLAVSFAVTRLMGSFLVGVSTFDPPTLLAVVALLVVVSIVASVAPALRAARVDPAGTLRAD